LKLPGEVVQLSMIIAQLRRVLGGQNYTTTELGEPDIPTFNGTSVSRPQSVPSVVYASQTCPLLRLPWWKREIPPAQTTAEGEPDRPRF
jgi:hypothetical protein